MPFINRDEQGNIVALSHEKSIQCAEELSTGSPELEAYIQSMGSTSSLHATDQDFVRVLEDVVELLVEKGIILFTDLPQSAQEKVMLRQQLRSQLGAKLDLIGDD